MTSVALRSALLVSIVFALAGAACKGGAGSTDTASSGGGAAPVDDPPTGSDDGTNPAVATPQVIFEGRLETGSGSDCTDPGPLFVVGELGDPSSGRSTRPVKNGETFEEGVASVTCSVIPSGDASYQVKGSLTLSGPNGGGFDIDGSFAPDAEATGINVVVSRASGGTYSSTSCRARYTSTLQGVAPGRVWAEITCPAAASNDGSQSCDVVAQVRLENCTQE